MVTNVLPPFFMVHSVYIYIKMSCDISRYLIYTLQHTHSVIHAHRRRKSQAKVEHQCHAVNKAVVVELNTGILCIHHLLCQATKVLKARRKLTVTIAHNICSKEVVVELHIDISAFIISFYVKLRRL